MSNTKASCPVCHSREFAIVYRVFDHHRCDVRPAVSIGRCLKCNTIFLAEANHFFQEDLYSYYAKYSGSQIEDLVSPLTLASYSRVLKRLSKITNLVSILDVGCGKGEFVWAAQKAGYSIKGIEMSPEAVSVACGSGLPVQEQSLFSSELDSFSWSAITMFEVIEHVETPVAMIKRAVDLLAPGGVLYLTTPNYDSLDRLCLGKKWNVFHSEHVVYFSTRGLACLVLKHEPRLELISLESINISPQLFVLVRRLLRLPFFRKSDSTSSGLINEQVSVFDLRAISEGTNLLRSLKRLINHVLTILGIGSTTIMIARKRND